MPTDEKTEPVRVAAAGLVEPRIALLPIRLQPPVRRDGIISRAVLVDRMLTRRAEPVVAVVAPLGYGKSTLLAEWATRLPHAVAWVSTDEGDNDPSVLLAGTTTALSQAIALDRSVVAAVCGRTLSIPRALHLLTSAFDPKISTTLVFDNVDSIDNVVSLDLIAELAGRLPVGSQVAYSSRSPLPLPIALLRSRGAVVEIGRDDLAMGRAEAVLLLARAGATLSADEIDALVEQTEGWPVALYLAALASKLRWPAATTFAFRGDEAILADYLRAEVLTRLPGDTVSFLTRTSVLEELSGPLCDAILGEQGSREMLRSLEASNLLLVPLDHQRDWYRYHKLFRDLLVTELEHREPDLVPELHRRAAAWFEAHGLPEPAIRQAQRGGDAAQVARLVAATVQPAYAAGRAADVRGWLEWFRAEGLIDSFPQIAAVGALVEALSGHPAGAERWAAAAEAGGEDHHGDGASGTLAFLRSVLCRRGPAQMRADAQLADELLEPANALRSGALLCEALSFLLEGKPDDADALLAHTGDVAVYMSSLPVVAAASAFRAVIAMRREAWDEARGHGADALSVITTGHLDDYVEASIVFAAAAQVAAHDGHHPAAAGYLARASRLRPLHTYAVPVTALMQLEIVRGYLQVGDPVGARTVLREVRDLLQQRPDLGVVAHEAAALGEMLDAMKHGLAGASSLTAAEFRLLPFLPTHLSFQEIAERLFVSRYTVKSQAISLYRKFAVSSRSEAVLRAVEIGLLGN